MVGWATPTGTTKIVSKRKDPYWTPPESVRKEHAAEGDILPPRVPPGPDNPLGAYAMNLGWPTLPDARHEQAGRCRHAREPRLHPHVSGGHRELFEDRRSAPR